MPRHTRLTSDSRGGGVCGSLEVVWLGVCQGYGIQDGVLANRLGFFPDPPQAGHHVFLSGVYPGPFSHSSRPGQAGPPYIIYHILYIIYKLSYTLYDLIINMYNTYIYMNIYIFPIGWPILPRRIDHMAPGPNSELRRSHGCHEPTSA